MNRLHTFCTDNKPAVNVGKTKSVKFRRGGPLRKSDVPYYEGRKNEFVHDFTYLGVIMQTKGEYSGHIQNLKRKSIPACTRVALRLPLTSMSLQSLERLLCTVILPSCMYGLALYESQIKECDFDYLDVVHGRLIKAWFGVSKFCSTTRLQYCAAGGDTMETSVRSCVLPTTTWGSYGLVRGRRGRTSCPLSRIPFSRSFLRVLLRPRH